LKLKYDKVLSSFAFKLNLRHYIMATLPVMMVGSSLPGGAVQVDSIKTGFESAPAFSARN